ncbi:MAG: PSD1 and planctomycete cytochrome C domain-containing protein [Pirellulales bacterium]
MRRLTSSAMCQAPLMGRGFQLLLLVASWLLPAVTGWSNDEAGPPVSFVRDVRPILAQHCFACHGPDEEQRAGDLRLDTREGLTAPRDGHPAVVARQPADSELWRRVTASADDERMPPPKAGPRLTADQLSVLRRWIEQGAEWRSHWAFEKPIRPALPAVKRGSWPRQPLDFFILARLEAAGLEPAPEADKRTLGRRVAFDLTGLPPPRELFDAYLRDDSPQAYEKYVDELLKLPSYGERWARLWLDLARYADTKGYEKDRTRTIWRYRDWVIDALDRDLPYDQFTTEQLAGDLLPSATPDQMLATAFHRNTMVNEEGGTDDEEFRVAAVKDRVDTTIQVWMGLTMGCSKCHSHKYDPISQREYYQFYAFFNQTEDSDKGDDRPTLATPTPTQVAAQTRIRDELTQLRRQLEDLKPQLNASLGDWERSLAGRGGWLRVTASQATSASGSPIKPLDDQSLLVGGPGPAQETYTVTLPLAAAQLPAGQLTALRLEALPHASLPRGGVGRSHNDGNFVLTGLRAELRVPGKPAVAVEFARAEADFAQQNYPVEHVLRNPQPRKHGWAVSPQLTQPHTAVFTLTQPLAIPAAAELVVTLDHQFEFSFPGFSLGRFRLSVTSDPSPSLQGDLPDEILAILRRPAGERTAAEQTRLTDHYATVAPLTQPVRERLARKEAELQAIRPPQTPVLRELPEAQRRVTRIQVRGNFLEPSDVVEPGVPASLAAWPADAPRNRLGVAQWLLHPDNPLTARVAANRHWAQFFGSGLVEPQEDFGSQGQPPSHPELLDWLAWELRAPSVHEGAPAWSLKTFCRLLVTSATYRQSSRVSAAQRAHDPQNRLLGRAARPRLEAEMIRDAALATAGLLSRKRYGPSVMPLQPAGIWRSTYNTDKWITSEGEDRYRRSLYTFVKRTSPYPSMTTFDAPSREICTLRRISTNTPLQALVTLNDPVFVECAQALARRALREGGRSLEARLTFLWDQALLRPPTTAELAALTDLYQRRWAEFRSQPEAAREFATQPLGPLPPDADAAELAAFTAISNVVLNLDEFLTRS